MVLKSCDFPYDLLSVHQISFNFSFILSEICSGQTFIAKITKGSNSVNIVDRVMVLALCNSPYGPLSVYQNSLNYLQYF